MHSQATTQVIDNALERFRQRRTLEVRETQKQGAKIHKDVAIQLCPVSNVEHIHLYETIEHKEIDGNTHEVSAGDAEHEYADALERGGEHTEAQPFFEPARQEARRWMNQEHKRH
jgi:hypothetical protein